MSSAPSITVVIPVKDDADLLERCLAALARQTRPADEIIVVDNGSHDLTAAVAARPGVRRLPNPEPGIPATASAGYDAAVGDVIARIDADSEPPDDWLERVAAAFAADPGLDAVTGPGDFPELRGLRRRLADLVYMESYFVLMGGLLGGRPPLFGSNFAMRAAVWRRASDRVHRHDARVHDDLDLSFCLGGTTVRLDRSLRMPVSSRPFSGVGSMLVRVWRGIYTVAVNVPPGRRSARSARRSRERSARRSTAPAAPERRGAPPASSPPR